jgi:cell division protein ZapA (FtsZ GTPase activity inhibitor)
MTENKRFYEYNILGSVVRFPHDEGADEAKKVVDLVISEINQIKQQKPNLKDIDVAVLAALKFASHKQENSADLTKTIGSVRKDVNEALEILSELSSS